MKLRYNISAMLLVATITAFWLGLNRMNFAWFMITFSVTNFLLVLAPLALIFATIVSADQTGQYLKPTTIPYYRTMKIIWQLVCLSAALTWIALMMFRGRELL